MSLSGFVLTRSLFPVCSFIDFDISPDGSSCNETYVVIGPDPCVTWCGTNFPRVYISARSYLSIRYVYRESGPVLRRGFNLKYFAGLWSSVVF